MIFNNTFEKTLQDKRVAILEPHSDFAENPSLICLADELMNNGAKVEVYAKYDKRFPKINDSIVQYPFPKKLRFWVGDLKDTLKNWKWYFKTYAWQGHKILKKSEYDLVFAINSEGVIAAFKYAQRKNVPFIYLSYEIYFIDELRKVWELREKEEEIKASQNAAIIVIQDKQRANLLIKENDLSESQIAYLPVSPKSSKYIEKSNFLRERFCIPENKLIVLHSGSFESWNCAEELIQNVNKWPQDVILVIHTRSTPKKKHKYISRIKRSKFKNIILSTKPLESHEYEEMVSSADIGLVLYKSCPPDKGHQKNIMTIGLSSGKFSNYIKHHIPVISLNQSIYSELLHEYKFGINLNNFNEMPEAIQNIKHNYELYSKESRRLFLERIDFNIYWPDLLRRICEIIK